MEDENGLARLRATHYEERVLLFQDSLDEELAGWEFEGIEILPRV